jgi:VanZ family protein
MVVIYVLSAQSKLPVPKQAPLHWLTETLAHPGEYAILAWLLWRWLTGSGASRGSRLIVALWAIALVYALLDEYHQSFVPGRVADWRDLLADALGAATALALLSIPAVARLCSRRAGRALKDSS